MVTDHSPSTPELKLLDVGDLGLAWGGIASLQFGFAAVWQAAATAESRSPRSLSGCPGAGRTRRFGTQGPLQIGADADLVALADDETFTVTTDLIQHRHPITPYLGQQLTGVVRARWLRGTELTEDMVAGRLLTHDTFRE